MRNIDDNSRGLRGGGNVDVRMDGASGKRASTLYFAALCLLALAGCGSEKPKQAAGDPGGCEDAVCARAAPAIDWSAKNPTYDAHVRVVNAAGDPVKDAV